MLNPIGNNIALPQPLTLVATPLPNSIAMRAPYDNIMPSISSSELNNNASNKNGSSQQRIQQPTIQIPVSNNQEIFSVNNTNSTPPITTAQTIFLAQLASGDISPEIRTIFAQYDKLVSYSNVKYKPSNAGKPSEPSGMFSNFLKEELHEEIESPYVTIRKYTPVVENNYTNNSFAETTVKQPLIEPAKTINITQIRIYKETMVRNDSIATHNIHEQGVA